MASDFYYPPTKNAVQKTLAAQLLSTATTGDAITFDDVDGIPNKPGVLVINRVDSNGTATASSREYISYSGTSGNTVLIETRNVDGSASAKTHSVGSITEFIPDIVWANRLIDQALVEHGQDGTHDATKVAMLAGTQTFTGNKTFSGTVAFSGTVSGVAAFWATVPGTPTRVSDTQFTITDTSNANGYDTLFKKGVILKWLESSTFQTAMIISSSYGTNTVTINIVGDSLTAGFSAMQYAIPNAMRERFIIPGTLSAATNVAHTFRTPYPIYVLSCDASVITAGTTNATEFDVNDDGTSLFGGTAASIASGGTQDEDNVAAAPSTAVAEESLITVDINSVSTTAPVEAYIDVWYYPVSWSKR